MNKFAISLLLFFTFKQVVLALASTDISIADWDFNGTRIIDFSRCGYKSSDIPIPDVKTVIHLTPQPGSKDDAERIQKALDQIGEMNPDKDGIRGALMLGRGIYRIAGTIRITRSGVVLRGAGQTEAGTMITAIGTKKRNVIELGNVKRPYPRLACLKKVGEERNITDSYLPSGSNSFHVESSDGLKKGDNIIIYFPPSEEWIKSIGMDNIGMREGKRLRWKSALFYQRFERNITGINGKEITIDIPLAEAINSKYGTGVVCKYEDPLRVTQCGIENLLIRSEYKKDDQEDENHAWNAIVVDKVRDCWIKNVSSEYMGLGCVLIEGSARNVTIQDCACLNPVSRIMGGRRYGFCVNGQMNLVQRCYANENRHAFSTNGKVRGPNVFLDCLAENNYNDIGPHQCWAVGTLYDNISASDGTINVQNRGTCGAGQGWAGAYEVLWNCAARQISCQSPPGAINFCIGCIGRKSQGYQKGLPDGVWKSHNKHVDPRSLFIQQLISRTDTAHAGKIVNDQQLKGNINKSLIQTFRPAGIRQKKHVIQLPAQLLQEQNSELAQ